MYKYFGSPFTILRSFVIPLFSHHHIFLYVRQSLCLLGADVRGLVEYAEYSCAMILKPTFPILIHASDEVGYHHEYSVK